MTGAMPQGAELRPKETPPGVRLSQSSCAHVPRRPQALPVGTPTDRSDTRVLTLTTSAGAGYARAFAARFGLVHDVSPCVVLYLLVKGVGIWGIDIPVGWGFAITSFVWWIGIGHAGTLISAILLLLHQKWRTSINRIAEAMTIFAVMCAGTVSAPAPGPAVVLLLAVALSEHDAAVAAVPQRPGVGRVRGQHVFHRVADVLVHGHDSGPGHAARPGPDSAGRSFTACWRWAGAIRPGTGIAMKWPTCSGRPGDAAGRLGALGRQFRLRHFDRARLARDGLSRLISSPGPFFPASRWCLRCCPSPAPLLRAEGFHHDRPPRSDGQDSAGDELSSHPTAISASSSSPGMRARSPTSYVYLNSLIGLRQYAVITWITLVCVVHRAADCSGFAGFAATRRSLFRRLVLVLVGMWMERYMLITTRLSRDFLPSSWGMFQPTIWDS